MLRLDHLAVAGLTVEAATDHVEQALNLRPGPGGKHAHFSTHNTLLGLGPDEYLEAIAIDTNAPAPAYPRWFDLDGFDGPPRLNNWILACGDLPAALAALGPGYGKPIALSRGDLRWSMAVPDSGVLPFDGWAPALIQWDGDAHPAPRLTDSAARISGLVVSHPKATEMAATLTPYLSDPRITFAEGPASLTARFTTASGDKTLR